MESYQQDNPETISLDEQARNTLIEMSKWTKLLSIFGFICIGLMIGFGLFMAMMFTGLSNNTRFGNISAARIIVTYSFMAAVIFYPLYALLRYSTGIRKGLATNDKHTFNEALNYLKNVFKYTAIVYLITIGIYAILMTFLVLVRL